MTNQKQYEFYVAFTSILCELGFLIYKTLCKTMDNYVKMTNQKQYEFYVAFTPILCQLESVVVTCDIVRVVIKSKKLLCLPSPPAKSLPWNNAACDHK